MTIKGDKETGRMTQFQVYLICIKIVKCVKFHTYEMKKTFEITNGEL